MGFHFVLSISLSLVLFPIPLKRIKDELEAFTLGMVEYILDGTLKHSNAIIVSQREHFQFLEVESRLIRACLLAHPVDIETRNRLVHRHGEEQRHAGIEFAETKIPSH